MRRTTKFRIRIQLKPYEDPDPDLTRQTKTNFSPDWNSVGVKYSLTLCHLRVQTYQNIFVYESSNHEHLSEKNLDIRDAKWFIYLF